MANETIEIEAKKITTFFALVVIFLIFAHIVGYVLCLYFGKLCSVFHLDIEQNIPTLFSSVALLFSSFLLFVMCFLRKGNKLSYLYWLVLGIIFLFLAVDETISVHEKLIMPLRTALNTSGIFYFAWVIPYGIALIIFLIPTIKNLFTLPKRIRLLFVAAGITYVSGALGMELLGGRHFELYGPKNHLYFLITSIEEILEMSGIVIFIHALLTYIKTDMKNLTFKIV
ncbi:MAG: hypothetical protein HKP12_11275 [Gammaproteobacteria bacterium]|nr:hypothetical protein [Gammaproteobacteria bacterium]